MKSEIMKKKNLRKNIYLKMGDVTHRGVDILKPFTRNYSVKLTATSISKISKVPQQTVSRILNFLLKLNLIEYAIQGKNKLFYFDKSKITTSFLFIVVEEILPIKEIILNCEKLLNSLNEDKINKIRGIINDEN